MNVTVALQILGYLAANKDAIKQLILSIEGIVGEIAGPDKAAIVKQYVATALSVEAQVEQAWPLVAPLFNTFVALVKKPA